MKSYLQRTIPERLDASRIATTNGVSVPALLVLLTKKDYNADKIAAGNALYNVAAAKVSKAIAKLGEQKAATDHAKDSHDAVKVSFQNMAKLARTIFADDPGALGIMGLTKPMSSARADLLVDAKALFNTTEYTPAMRAALLANEYDDSKLSSERSKIGELEFAIQVQAQCKSAYQQAKAQQKTALKALDKWMGRFLRVARLAVADNPQMLEHLGVIARTGPTKAQRAGRRKAAETRKKQQPVLVSVSKAA